MAARCIAAHSPALCGLAGLRAARLGIPLVYEIRAFWEDAAVGNGTGRQGNLKYNLTRRLEDYVVARARCGGDNLRWVETGSGRAGNAPGRITIMPNGVDLTLFGARHRADDAFARELGLGDGPVIGFIGSFYDYEGARRSDRGHADPTAHHPDARLLMVGGACAICCGSGRRQSGGRGDPFVAACPIPRSNVTMPCATSWLSPQEEPLTDLVTPLKPLEAMAQGKLVAASDVGAIAS
jgi:hypothetical protein